MKAGAVRHGVGVVAAAVAGILAGCAPTARFVLMEPAGGAVAIQRNTPGYREKAVALMIQKCPGGYEINREEEVVTGEIVTKDRSSEFDKIREEMRTTEERRTRRTMEWRITFTCRAGR